ncbi:hypothetical protein BKA67DRAFT_203655 [Truncatella angustata]|uniref:3-beta hydroxysteroid dehydrogenase/isomerase domain-containing protein n=1 Tax=Truncatella angustata TaxID=152316 RepID=A0A9P8UTE7_9PEZI|nr:uncharacterized protein BKA67DRAFT_203655 [Truncatella angustata]KAH6657986.1 hypothetical protein BKA67DRAFT_203655 [Truncatella angustata]
MITTLIMANTDSYNWFYPAFCLVVGLAILYLVHINQLLKDTPEEIRKLAGSRWTEEQLKSTYERLEKDPIDYVEQLPPRLDRRYIVTGGNGLVGGFIVLQLLARGQSPKSIRILDIRKAERNDMLSGPATEVDFVYADITSRPSLSAAFRKEWHSSVAHLPLTVFHTAAVIIPSDRSKYFYRFPEAINVHGTQNVLNAAKEAGADIFSSTSSGSIAIRPIGPWVAPWAQSPRRFWQILDEKDFLQPLRRHEDFFGNYPASKAAAERIVCDANTGGFQTGCIRPVNGVYGNPTDNTVGEPLARAVLPTWVSHIVQSFVHGANVAIAHLHHEAALTKRNAPQAGRPFCVTDPNPPITYSDLYMTIKALSVHPFLDVHIPPVIMLLLSHILEWYSLLPFRVPFLRKILPVLKGDIRYLKPGLFSICTHLVGSNAEASRSVEDGGLGYKGVITTLEGMALEVLEWNREHADIDGRLERKVYTTSVSAAEKIQQLGIGGLGSTDRGGIMLYNRSH